MINSIKKWALMIVVFALFFPFYLVGATVGMFVGVTMQGHKDSLNFIRDCFKKLNKKRKGE